MKPIWELFKPHENNGNILLILAVSVQPATTPEVSSDRGNEQYEGNYMKTKDWPTLNYYPFED